MIKWVRFLVGQEWVKTVLPHSNNYRDCPKKSVIY